MQRHNRVGRTSWRRQAEILLLCLLSISGLTGCPRPPPPVILSGNVVWPIYSGASTTVRGPAFCLGPEALARLLEKAESRK